VDPTGSENSAEIRRLGGWGAKQPVHEERESLVEPVDQRHHDADKYEHNARVAEQFASGRCDNLPQLDEDLADEKRDTCKRATPLGALLSRVGDDVLTGLVDHFACHTHNLSLLLLLLKEKHCPKKSLQGGQDLNLQPAVLETAALPIEPPPYVRNQQAQLHLF
jgi:hypothetical protein